MNKSIAKTANNIIVTDALKYPWALVLRAIDVGWIENDNLQELIHYVENGKEIGYEEFSITPNYSNGTEVIVSFLSEEYSCCSKTINKLLRQLNA